MANREKQKMKYPRKLEPILYDKEWTALRISNDNDIYRAKLFLDDYDWMYYKLSAHLPTRAYGDIEVEFAYGGFGCSMMSVKIKNDTYFYRFDLDLFKECIIKFIRQHIKNWDEKNSLNGLEEIANFYNTVITSPNTVQEKSQII